MHLKRQVCSSLYRRGNRHAERTSDVSKITQQAMEEVLETKGIFCVWPEP